MLAPLAGAALAQWQSVGFVFTVAGGALAALGLAVLAIRPPVGVDVPGGEQEAGPPDRSDPPTATEEHPHGRRQRVA
jgi:hypothetical protein